MTHTWEDLEAVRLLQRAARGDTTVRDLAICHICDGAIGSDCTCLPVAPDRTFGGVVDELKRQLIDEVEAVVRGDDPEMSA